MNTKLRFVFCFGNSFLLFFLLACGNALPLQSTWQPTVTVSSTDTIRTVAHLDLPLAQDEWDLIRNATLIIHGTPVGEVERVDLTDGILSSYRQNVQVKRVLKGEAPGEVVRIAKSGLSPAGQARTDLFVAEGEFITGPLHPGEYVLFLAPSAVPDIFYVVGYSQGTLILDENGRVAPVSAEEEEERVRFKAFEALTVQELQEKINSFSAEP